MSTIGKIVKDQELYKDVARCNDRCRKCIHGSKGKTQDNICNYIIDTGHRRPCAAGTGCTEYRTKRLKRKFGEVQE